MTLGTPKSTRTHIAIYGRRNVGKSSLLNALIHQEVSIVSHVAGTTTDPVEKAYELLPFGPVLFIDTAGIDDEGYLGKKRVTKTQKIILQTDLALLIIEPNIWGPDEEKYLMLFQEKNLKYMVIINKTDTITESALTPFIETLKKKNITNIFSCSANTNQGIDKLRENMASLLEKISPPPPLITDLVKPANTILMVIPIDKETPAGRLILPEVQVLRELLNIGCTTIVVKDTELTHTLTHVLKEKPRLVITDSQAFEKVSALVPANIQLTSFSILMARQKGDLKTYIEGLKAIPKLKNNDRILVSELCSHHVIGEDIGRVKIPHWLQKKTGVKLQFDTVVAKDFPQDVSAYKLIIQCGGCMANRKYIMSKIQDVKAQNVPITNYGLIIAYLYGILDRVLEPFQTKDNL